MLPPKERMCHRTGFTQSCRELVVDEKCGRWMRLTGQHPTEDRIVDEHRCMDDWVPVLLLENSKLQRSTAAAVESFRNEMVQANNMSLALQARDMMDHLGLPPPKGD